MNKKDKERIAVRPMVLSVAAWDPSGCAGLAADVKTFEQHKVYGLGVITAITSQTEDVFYDFQEVGTEKIFHQLEPLLNRYHPKYVKIGMCPHRQIIPVLDTVLRVVPDAYIAWDPVVKTSTGFRIPPADKQEYEEIFKRISLFLPNFPEVCWFEQTMGYTVERISRYTDVLVKGGHRVEQKGMDVWYSEGKLNECFPATQNSFADKRGTGCILSASLVANLSLGMKFPEAVVHSKQYMEKILSCRSGKMAYHVT